MQLQQRKVRLSMKKTLIVCSLLCLLAAATSTAASSASSSPQEKTTTTKAVVDQVSTNSTTEAPEISDAPDDDQSNHSLKQISLFGNPIGVYHFDWAIELERVTADTGNTTSGSNDSNSKDESDPGYIIELPLGDGGNALQLKVDMGIEKALPIRKEETSTTETPTTQTPTTQKPTTQAPTTQKPVTQAPTTQKPVTQAPTTQKPATQAPTTQTPTTKKPTTQTPTTTKKPTTQAPTTTKKPSGSGAKPEQVAPKDYTEEDLLWLARIIHAEARGESMEAKVAVGTVVMNRVASSKFPNTIYGVIFQKNQFSPVRAGTIYNTPSASCYEAARRCLEGERTDTRILYFMMTKYASGTWMDRTRKLIVIIGSESFYA